MNVGNVAEDPLVSRQDAITNGKLTDCIHVHPTAVPTVNRVASLCGLSFDEASHLLLLGGRQLSDKQLANVKLRFDEEKSNLRKEGRDFYDWLNDTYPNGVLPQ